MSIADAIVEQGLDKLGYQYVISLRNRLHQLVTPCGRRYVLMDDCWSDTSRNATGHLQPKASQFPHGFNYLTGNSVFTPE